MKEKEERKKEEEEIRIKEKGDLASTGEPPVEVSTFIPALASNNPISSSGNTSTSR